VSPSPQESLLGVSSSHESPDLLQPYEDELPTIIDTFAPRPPVGGVSPTSSVSSDLGYSNMNRVNLGKSILDKFLDTRSRVVRVRRLLQC
jgi:hypothetical protein